MHRQRQTKGEMDGEREMGARREQKRERERVREREIKSTMLREGCRQLKRLGNIATCRER